MDPKEKDAVLKGKKKLIVLASVFLGRDNDKLEDFIATIIEIVGTFANTMKEQSSGQQIVKPESDLPNQLTKRVVEMAFHCQFITNPEELRDALRVGYKYLSTYVPDEEYEKALLGRPEHLKRLEQEGKTGNEADFMATMLATTPLIKEGLGDLDKDTEKFVALITHGKHTLETLREFLSSIAEKF